MGPRVNAPSGYVAIAKRIFDGTGMGLAGTSSTYSRLHRCAQSDQDVPDVVSVDWLQPPGVPSHDGGGGLGGMPPVESFRLKLPVSIHVDVRYS